MAEIDFQEEPAIDFLSDEDALQSGFKATDQALGQVNRNIELGALATPDRPLPTPPLNRVVGKYGLEPSPGTQPLVGPALGRLAEAVPPGRGPITRPLSSLAKTGLGVGAAALEPENLATASLAISPPGALAAGAYFGYQTGKGALQSVRNIVNLMRQPGPVDEAFKQKLSDELVNALSMAVATGEIGAGEARSIRRMVTTPPVQGPLATGAILPPRVGAVAPRAEVPGAPLTVPPEVAAAQARRMQKEATAAFEPAPPPKATVPGTPAEPRITAAEEVRAKKADTISKILQIFPSLQGNRSKARAIGKAAWGEQWPEQPVPKPKAAEVPAEDLRPAVKTEETAPPAVGQPGETHADVIAKTGKEPESIPHEDERRGFVDVNQPEKLISRTEAEDKTGLEGTADAGGLDSQDLPAAQPVAPAGIEATVIAGKTLGEWENVKDASQLPKGSARAELAKWLAVPNQPARILQALGNKKRTREIHAPPATLETVTPVEPEKPAESPKNVRAMQDKNFDVYLRQLNAIPEGSPGLLRALRAELTQIMRQEQLSDEQNRQLTERIEERLSKEPVELPSAEPTEPPAPPAPETPEDLQAQLASEIGEDAPVEAAAPEQATIPTAATPQATEPTVLEAKAAVDAIKAKMDANRAEADKLFAKRKTVRPSESRQNELDINALAAEFNNLEQEMNKAELALRTAQGQAGIERMRRETAPFRGVKVEPSPAKVTTKTLKAQKENLLQQVDDAIKEAPEKGEGKILISVPGDGDFTLINTKEALRKFRSVVDKGAVIGTSKDAFKQGPFPTKIEKASEPGLPSVKPKAMPKAVDPNPEDLPAIGATVVSPEKERFVITTAYADGTQIISTDGRQLLRIVTDEAPGTVNEPVRLDEKGNVVQGQGDYPNYNQIISDSPDLMKGGADSGQLWHLANQALKIWHGIDEAPTVKLWINQDGSLGMSSKVGTTGDEYSSNVQDGAKWAGDYNGEYLFTAADVARRLGNEKVDLYAYGDTGPIEIRGQNHQQIIMPIRSGNETSFRDALNTFTPGPKSYGPLAKGLGPLRNPEAFFGSEVANVQGTKFQVTLEGGKFTVKQLFPKTGRYGGTDRWDDIASFTRHEFGGGTVARKKVIGEAIKKGTQKEASKAIVAALEKAALDVSRQRERVIEEGKERLKGQPEPGPGPIGMGGAALGEIQATGPRGEPTHGIAARVLEQRRQQGVIAPVEPGEGISPEESIERGRALLAAGANPERVLADFKRTKAVSADGIAIVRAEGERLARAAYAAADNYGINSPQYEAAWEADSAWAKATKPLQTEWHKIGMAQQGETEIDTGTFHGLRHAFFEATGRDFTKKQAKTAVDIAKGVKEATEAEGKAKAEVFAQIGKEATTTPEKPATPAKPGKVAVPDAMTLWKRAKGMIDAGEDDFDSLRHKLAKEFGIPVEEVKAKLAESKIARKLTDDMYRKMSERRRMVAQAKNWLKNEQIPGWLNFIRKVPRVFFTAKILGHGTVGMITHAGLNIFNPVAWRHYWPNFFRQYKLIASRPYHERMMADLLHDPLFTKARRAGLANDPFRYQDDYSTPTLIKWLDRIGLTGNRGFDALKLFRQARFNQIWNSLPDTLQTPEYAKLLADSVNHATGVIRRPFREWANWTFFAPRLEASRWAWMVKDPWDAAKTFVDWNKAAPEEKAFAMSQLKEKAAIAGAYYSLLMMNQGLLSASGSDQNINFTNPRRGDFLAFKASGHNIGIVGPMLGMVRLFANLIHAAVGKRGKVESLEPRAAEFGQMGFEYARGKLSPFAGFGVDVISQADFQGRPMPYSKDAVPKYLREQGIGRYTYGQYAAQEFTPIPISEAVREVWHDQGMHEDEITTWLNALAVGVGAGSTGARISPQTPERKTKK